MGAAAILNLKDQTFTLDSLSKKFTKVVSSQLDKRVFSARHEGVSLSEYNEPELKKGIDRMIVFVSSIYGVELASTKFLAETLRDSTIDFLLQSGYGNLTIAEIKLSAQINALGVKWPYSNDIEVIKFSGNYFNVFFLARILEKYMDCRRIMDRMFINYLEGLQ